MKEFSRSRFYVEKEEELIRHTLKKFKMEFMLYEACFDMFMETFECVIKSAKTKPFDTLGKNASVFILPRVIQSLQSYRLLIIRGQYYDSAVIARSLGESIGLCAHLSSQEEEAKLWMHGKPIKTATIHLLDLARWLSNRRDDPKVRFSYRAAYGEMCDYVHTNIRSLIGSMVTRPRTRKQTPEELPRNLSLQIAPYFDKKEVKFAAAYPLLATLVVQDIFETELKPYKNRKKKMDELLDLYFHTRQESISSLSRHRRL